MKIGYIQAGEDDPCNERHLLRGFAKGTKRKFSKDEVSGLGGNILRPKDPIQCDTGVFLEDKRFGIRRKKLAFHMVGDSQVVRKLARSTEQKHQWINAALDKRLRGQLPPIVEREFPVGMKDPQEELEDVDLHHYLHEHDSTLKIVVGRRWFEDLNADGICACGREEEGRGAPRPEEMSGDSPSQSGNKSCLLYTSPSPRDRTRSRMPSSA